MLKKAIVLVSIVLLAWATVVAIDTFEGYQERITIAIAAPLSNASESAQRSGRAMVDGAQLYIKQVNKAGGVKGKKFKLEVYDDQGNPDVAQQVAKKIAQSNAIAVIGHYSSGVSTAAGKVYQDYKIPAVTGSATADGVTQSNSWYFRTIFSNSAQGTFIANYIKKILGSSKISLVSSSSSSYGLTLGKTVEETFQELGGEVVSKWVLGDDIDQGIETIYQDLLALKNSGKDPGVIVMTANRNQVAGLIAKMKSSGMDFPIFGGDSLAEISLAQRFEYSPEEKDEPGFFTNGIYAIAPIIFDISDDGGQQFRNEFEKQYKQAPGWVATCYYDAAKAIVEAIKRSDITWDDLPKDRLMLKESLATINSQETAFKGATRNIYFDYYGNAVAPVFVGIFDRRNFISAFSQLQIIPDLRAVANLEEQLDSGEIVKVGNNYMVKTHIVYTGMDINEISHIDEKTSSYLVDFFIWFRYQGDITADQIEFTNYGIERLDSGEKLTLKEPIDTDLNNDIKYKVYRVKADFHEKFDFHDYPFDLQTLSARFRHLNLTRDKLIYVVDFVGMRDTTTEEVLKNWKTAKVFDQITDWSVESAAFFQDTVINNSTLGNRRFIDTDSDIEYSRFNVVIKIKRDLVSFSIKNLLPLLFFVVVGYLFMFLPFDHMSVEAVSGLLLAIVFYHLSLIEGLPEGVGYVVALDYAFYIVYILNGLQLLMVVIGNSEGFQSGKIKISKLMEFGRVAFPVILVVYTSLLCWRYL
ncbi:ABC transporter substrate-binding protein [Moorena sp. SIO3I6]|uniref:ABC transporter substrate-binding protein n=1 Tax=Moorena sp. SIO3I6 TaxID=2607831 RepID=UPI0013F94AB9|nr:ABC transporter substrate-binding protein [Moorena sp. SIO3I6]NEP22798.1 ABC transporter substrate-binding protein [Moorena sp. SIO3I6]